MKKNGYLSDEEIVDLIKNYIEDKVYSYAVLIDGEWGSGKTYFVNTVLKNRIKADLQKKVIYVSLYGIKSIGDISNELYIGLADEKIGGTLRKLITTGAKIGSDTLKVFGVEISNYTEEIKNIADLKDYILIFDDLERCECNINEVLGFINSFVEHEGMKVILIANESEIGKYDEGKNQELKYLIASSDKINFDDGFEIIDTKQNDEKKVTFTNVKQRAKLIFEENTKYKQIKEKLIGVTVKYRPDFKEIYSSLIFDNVKDEDLAKILKRNLDGNLRYSEDEKHYNLRTYQFFLSKIKYINKIIKDEEYEEYENLMNNICNYCHRICVLYKSGIYNNIWGKESLYRKVGYESSNTIIGFKFIDDYIVDSKIDKRQVVKVINLYLEEEKLRKKNKEEGLFYFNWWEMDEKEVRCIIEKIMSYLQNNDNFIKTIPRALQLLIGLESFGFESKIVDDAVQIIKDRIEKETDFTNFDEYSVGFEKEDQQVRYKKIIEEINSKIDIITNSTSIEKINSCLDSEDWGVKLFDYFNTEKRNASIKERNFISKIDMNKLEVRLKDSDSFNISKFRYVVHQIYDFSSIKEYYSNDINNIEKIISFIKKIENDTEFDLIKVNNLKMLRSFFEKIIKKLS